MAAHSIGSPIDALQYAILPDWQDIHRTYRRLAPRYGWAVSLRDMADSLSLSLMATAAAVTAAMPVAAQDGYCIERSPLRDARRMVTYQGRRFGAVIVHKGEMR